MEAVIKFLKTHEVPLFGLSGSVLLGYLFLRKHLWNQTK